MCRETTAHNGWHGLLAGRVVRAGTHDYQGVLPPEGRTQVASNLCHPSLEEIA
jgi:hypothetical protein